MSYGTPRHQVVLGGCVLAAFAAFAISLVIWMRADPRLLGTTRTLLARLPERSGLQIGDPVEIDGVRVGTVRSIRREVVGGAVSFLIRCEASSTAEPLQWLGPASRARARTANLLGDVVLSIAGDAEGRGWEEGRVIPGDASPSFDRVLADVEAATASVRSITAELESALGAKDASGLSRAEVVARAVERTTASLERFAAGAAPNGAGGLAELLSELATSAANLRQITEDVRTVTARVRTFFGPGN
ncbi:MAG: MCE family protein [Planctomycetes bacterium]|nr:MCE family protein [Planctomycetota bacterium]